MKKSMLTLFAFSALISSDIYSAAMIKPAINPNQPQMQPTTNTQTLQQVYGTNLSDANTVMHDKMNGSSISSEFTAALNSALASGMIPANLAADAKNALATGTISTNLASYAQSIGLNLNTSLKSAEGMISAVVHTLPNNDDLEHSIQKLGIDAQNAFEQLRSEFQAVINNLRSYHMDRMHKDQAHMMQNQNMHPVVDLKGNVIGAYQTLGDTKGYRYGSFYTNMNQAPASVIENGANQGTPVTVAVPGASSTIIGYINNPNYNSSMKPMAGSASQMITLYQYVMPAQPVTMPANRVQVQSYHNHNDDEDEDNHKHHRHHDNDHDDEHHHLISIF